MVGRFGDSGVTTSSTGPTTSLAGRLKGGSNCGAGAGSGSKGRIEPGPFAGPKFVCLWLGCFVSGADCFDGTDRGVTGDVFVAGRCIICSTITRATIPATIHNHTRVDACPFTEW